MMGLLSLPLVISSGCTARAAIGAPFMAPAVSAAASRAPTPGSTAAEQPQWIATSAALPPARPVTFRATLEASVAPDKALLRVAAYDRYRLLVNGRGVSIGDTPWDAETYDVTRLIRAGSNVVEVAASADAAAPRNCWLWLRRDLPTPGRYGRLSFRTRQARANEWLYIEVVDLDGHTSGLYCLETGRRDLMLGTDGGEVEHTIELTTEQRLDYRPQVGDRPACDFTRLAAIGIRVDQKDALANPSGGVELLDVKLEGERSLDLTAPSAWRLEPGVGEYRRSTLAAGPNGSLALRYDFTPAADPKVAVDLALWRDGKEIAHLASGPAWQADGAPARLVASPADLISWMRLAVTGPREPADEPRRAGLMLDFGGADRCAEGESLPASVQVWPLEPLDKAAVEVRVESWSGQDVHRESLPVEWTGAEGQARFRTPPLPRGLYRFTATLPGMTAPDRHAALAVLPPGASRLSSLFDALTPLPSGTGLQGIDLVWGDSPALLLGIRDQGVNFLQFHLDPQQLDNGEFEELLAFCRATGLRFALNNENANWVASSLDPTGRDRFVAPGGCHRWDLEPGALDRAAATGLFEGVVYDEGEHMQLSRNFYANLPDREHRQPYLVETTGMTLPAARAAFTKAAREVAAYNRAHGARMLVESVFPALWHPLAEAGVTLCPKLLKEDIHPVVLALALGAAKQYDADLWFSPDLWYLDRFPGHSAAEYAAALDLAHRAGVDNVYTEAAAALCRLRGVTYELTDYGVALRDHIRRRRESAPRGYTFRDYEPEVAIIRFPDSDWGQASCYYWKTLYGAENLPPTPETGEWLQVWSLLTGGATDPRAVNTNSEVYPRGTWQFAYPSPPVAVFDHRVGSGPLRAVQTIFLCGITISDRALAAVQQRVRDGAICFTPARLCPPAVREQAPQLPARVPDGTGAWVVVQGFTPDDLGPYTSLLPKAGRTMRLAFRGQQVQVPDVTSP